MDFDINDYLPFITDALNHVEQPYFLLPTTYTPIMRERVFCYEFYHQMRTLQNTPGYPRLSNLYIHAEIDKSGHKDFDKAHQANPDFIFHVPGEFKRNTIVVEVKNRLEKKGISKDLNTLLTFVSTYQYKIGILIVFNKSITQVSTYLRKNFSHIKDEPHHRYIWIIAVQPAVQFRRGCEVLPLFKVL